MSTPVLDRRILLQGGILLSLGALGAARPLLAKPAFAKNPFTLGVASGDPLPDGFVLWTRLAPEPLEPHGGMAAPMHPVAVDWEVAEDDGFRRIVKSGQARAIPELAHSVHVEVSGLQPQRRYWYRFRIGDAEVSPAGTVKTAPLPGALLDRVRFGVAGCQQYEQGYYTAYRSLAEQPELDFIFHYGDYIYEGQGGVNSAGIVVRPHVGDTLYSLDDYRRRYAQYKADPDLQAAHAAAAFVVSFDDHEVRDNWAGDYGRPDVPPEVFALRRVAAMQAWYEHMPLRAAQFPFVKGMTAFRRLDYGRLLRVHVLDTRSFRSAPLCVRPYDLACGAKDDASRTFLGFAQERWLADGLGGQAGWHLLAQQKLMMPFDTRKPGGAQPSYSSDNWDGYAAARARLVRAITDRKRTNVVVVSGDSHVNLIGSVPLSDRHRGGPAATTEFLATSVSSGGDGHTRQRPELLANNPDLKLFNGQRGYHLHEVTPKLWRTDVRVVDQIQKQGGTVSTFARFAVDPRQPGPQRL
jgi:alkaline phosphatase D